MKRIQEYQMLLNASKIPYLEKKKSYLCESNCNSPENVAEIMEKCFQMSNLPEEHVYAIALNTRSSVDGFGTIQFCSYTKKEDTDLFESWQAENGYNIPEYTVQTVYNRADAEEYGAEYFVKQRNYPE